MKVFTLDGVWDLSFLPETDGSPRHPDELAAANAPSIPARVPGNVELDLHRHGRLPDPFYANNMFALRPYESYEWWYARDFELPADWPLAQSDLVFEGLDTFASIWINGVEIGAADNMFIPHRFDAGRALRPGANRIVVRIASAMKRARRFEYDAITISQEHRYESMHVRKPASCWGWDIMPRVVSAGIWRSVRVEARPEYAIEQMYYWTSSIDPDGATLGARFQFRAPDNNLDGFSVRFRGICEDHAFEFEWPVEFTVDHCRIQIPGARLWNPRGRGAPHLYTVQAELLHRGEVKAARTDRIGLRTIVVRRTLKPGQSRAVEALPKSPARFDKPFDPESHFLFVVNGEPLQIRGTNWVPLDAFHSRDAERVEPALKMAADLECNMIRCWGGNVYEDHPFFDFCDEQGILVWQDMGFACSIHPQTPEFFAQIEKEIQSTVCKLRNHPSLAIWCGDNECDNTFRNEGMSPLDYRLSREIIPRAVFRWDPHRHCVPSSPVHGPEGMGPEIHLWGPRGYYKSPYYTHHKAAFIGEIGYHGVPNISSLKKFLSPEALWPWQDNREWLTHSVEHWRHRAVDRDRIRLMANQLREVFGEIPEDLESFVIASQIIQAEAKKYFIESTRLRKWTTSGVLWWNLIDGWPQFSDAIVDYHFGVKLAYPYIWRAQRHVALAVGDQGIGKYLPVVACNDTLEEARIEFKVWDADSGETLEAGTATVPANENWQVGRLRAFAGDQKMALLQWTVNGETCGGHCLIGTPPFSLEKYRRSWLPAIAALPPAFDAKAVGQ